MRLIKLLTLAALSHTNLSHANVETQDETAASCSLCPDGEEPVNMDFRPTAFGIEYSPFVNYTSCRDAYLHAPNVTEEHVCNDLTTYAGTACGCPSAPTPCSLCAGMVNPPFPDYSPPPHGSRCDYLNFVFAGITDETTCSESQAVYGPGCGCPGLSDGYVVCEMCPSGLNEFDPYGSGQCQQTAKSVYLSESEQLCAQRQDLFKRAECGCLPPERQYCAQGLCPGGEEPINSDLVIPYTEHFSLEEGITCYDLFEDVPFYTNETLCDTIQTFIAPVCGCPSAPVSCTLCPDGETSPNAGLETLLGDGQTCSAIEFWAVSAEETECASIQSKYAFACGCTGVAQPSCALCPGGEDSPNADTEIPLTNGQTCREVAFRMQGQDETQCASSQSLYAYACGCTGTTPSCTLCPNGEDLLDANMENPLMDDKTCGVMASFIQTFDDDSCASYQSSYAHACGCSGTTPPCTLCSSGEKPLYPDVEPKYANGLNCEELEVTFANIKVGTSCDEAQLFWGSDCGCPNVTTPTCSLCPGGEDPPYPDIAVLGIACGSIARDSRTIQDEAECAERHLFYAPRCQCPSAPESDSFICTVCPDGGDFNREIESQGYTCADAQSLVNDILDEAKCAEIQISIAEQCGCKGVVGNSVLEVDVSIDNDGSIPTNTPSANEEIESKAKTNLNQKTNVTSPGQRLQNIGALLLIYFFVASY